MTAPLIDRLLGHDEPASNALCNEAAEALEHMRVLCALAVRNNADIPVSQAHIWLSLIGKDNDK